MDDTPRRDEAHVPVGTVDFGHFRRLIPISKEWGFDRGLPIDRYYIERFLQRHAADIRGRVLEVGDNAYTRRFGGDRVTNSDVINLYGVRARQFRLILPRHLKFLRIALIASFLPRPFS